MLLTGFDAPIEQVMYLDRPLRDHTLLQAIARTNRTYVQEKESVNAYGETIKESFSKQYGFIVDYFGITHHLEEALQVFDHRDVDRPMEDFGAIYKRMEDYRQEVFRMFAGVDRSDLDAIMRVLEPEDKRAEFEVAYKRFASTLDALMPNHVNKQDLNDLRWMAYVRAAAKARFEPDTVIDIADCGEKARNIISEHLKAKGVTQWIRPISLSDKDFQKKMDTFKTDEAVASTMEHAIRHTISVKMDENPVHYTSLLEKLQKLLDETRMSWEERRAKLQEFIDKEIAHGEEDEARALGFSSRREYAFFLKIREILSGAEDGVVAEDAATYMSMDEIELYKDMTGKLMRTIEENRLDGFETYAARAHQVEKAIQKAVMDTKYSRFGYGKLKRLVVAMLELAKRHFPTGRN